MRDIPNESRILLEMNVRLPFIAVATLLFLCVPFTATYCDDPKPLVNAHAHNDFLHDRPLLDALDHGFGSIEVDVWLIDGKLLVAHDRDKVDPDLTLQKLYLDPLRDRVRKNGGWVYPGGPEIILLIDIKGNGRLAYPEVRKVLRNYENILTTFTDDSIEIRAVRAIISGSRPKEMLRAYDKHYAAYDGRLGDLESDLSSDFMPLISSNWGGSFKWTGDGRMPEYEREKLRDIVSRAHAKGRKLRFWATPHNETLWKELHDARVDLINADDLGRLKEFLLPEAN